MAKPAPRVVSEVCTLCGLDWNLHGKNPTAEGCVKLLLDEVRSLNARLATRPLAYPYIVPQPIYPRPYWPTWYTTGGTTSGGKTVASAVANYASGITPQPVSILKGSTA